jgi:hypothetical protein
VTAALAGPGRAPRRPADFEEPEDDRGRPAPRPDGPCANHPDRPAEAACAECGKALCPECFYASGGGHAFCRECMEASRLVDAEPQRLGRVVEVEDRPSGRLAALAVLLALAVLALAGAAFVIWALLSGPGGG